MQAAQRQALSTFDEAKRHAAYTDTQRIVIRDVPQLVLWWPLNVQYVSRDFRNFNPNLVNEMFGAHLWDI